MKTPTPEQLNKQVRDFGKIIEYILNAYEGNGTEILLSIDEARTILFALRLTAKMMEEPSDRMTDVGTTAFIEGQLRTGAHNAFKAMRDQAIKEINNPRQPDAGL